MFRSPRFLLIASLFFTVALSSVAHAQDTAVLLDRIERLERDIRTLNVQIARGGGGAPVAGAEAGAGDANQPAYARLNVRVSQLENQLRSMTGQLEQLTFSINQMQQQLDKMATDTDFRLGQLERGGTAGAQTGRPASPSQFSATPGQPSPASPPPSRPGSQVLGQITEAEVAAVPEPAAQLSEEEALLAQLTGETTGVAAAPSEPAPAPTPAPAPASVSADNAAPISGAQTASLPNGTPREQYMYAFGLLRQGQFDVAADALTQFLEANANDPLAGNARYWLGETYYVRGAYVEAAETFLEGFQTDPQGSKAADALLKLGMSLANLDKKQEACSAFQKLRTDYPSAPAGLKSTLQREWQKNGCV